jgi:hypothetical protein
MPKSSLLKEGDKRNSKRKGEVKLSLIADDIILY